MSSLVSGFEYDIFISYRHNDNLDGWVTDFVQTLEKELRSTLKEPISIYFDKNPHDGLLETHNVDKSLEGKLKCLIFIPIISQTYCDPKSFAWQHEFVAFNNLAKQDQFGRDIKLGNGNFTSRILPIKIHELDAEDKAIIEKEIGGALRGIDFIQKSSGVNRPLNTKDDEVRTTGKILYRDQVNKVANAIKEILYALKNNEGKVAEVPSLHSKKKSGKIKLPALAFAILILALVISYFAYSKFNASGSAPILDKSIAVLPFVDMSPAHDQEFFGDGVAEEIINVLVQSEDLKVIARTSSFQFKGKNDDLKKIGEILGVSNILEGSIRKSADQLRITAQLISTKDGSHLWSKTFDRPSKDILALQDEIAKEVARAFKLTVSGSHSTTLSSVNEEAYNAYLEGRYFFDMASGEANEKALEQFTKCIALDSSFAPGWIELAATKWRICGGRVNCPEWAEIKKLSEKGLSLDPGNSSGHITQALIHRGEYNFKDFYEEMVKAYKLDPRNPRALRNYGIALLTLNRNDEAIELCKKAIALDPVQPNGHRYLGRMYYYTGRYEEAYDSYKKAFELSPQVIATMQLTEYSITMMMVEGPDDALEFLKTEKSEPSRLAGNSIAWVLKNNLSESDISLKELISKYAGRNAYEIAQVYAFRKEKIKTMEWLNKAYQQKEPGILLMYKDPVFKSVWAEPNFKEIVAKLNIPK